MCVLPFLPLPPCHKEKLTIQKSEIIPGIPKHEVILSFLMHSNTNKYECNCAIPMCGLVERSCAAIPHQSQAKPSSPLGYYHCLSCACVLCCSQALSWKLRPFIGCKAGSKIFPGKGAECLMMTSAGHHQTPKLLSSRKRLHRAHLPAQFAMLWTGNGRATGEAPQAELCVGRHG